MILMPMLIIMTSMDADDKQSIKFSKTNNKNTNNLKTVSISQEGTKKGKKTKQDGKKLSDDENNTGGSSDTREK